MKESWFLAVIFGVAVFAATRDTSLAQVVSGSSSRLVFEVATVKVADPSAFRRNAGDCHGVDTETLFPGQLGQIMAGMAPLGRCVMNGLTLKQLLGLAYANGVKPVEINVPDDQFIIGGPGWTTTDVFNIEGKAEEPSKATRHDLYQMLYALVLERFQLVLHEEPREISGFVLTKVEGNSKLKQVGDGIGAIKNNPAGGSIMGKDVNMGNFAGFLQRRVGMPVTNKTDLPGGYDIEFHWDSGSGLDSAASISTLLREQLGLELKPQKSSYTALVIDRVQKPPE